MSPFSMTKVDPLSGGIRGRGESGETAAHDHQVVILSFGFGADASFGHQFSVGRFDEYRAVFKDYGRYDLLAVVQILDALAAFFVFANVDPVVADGLLAEILLRLPAIRTPRRAVNSDFACSIGPPMRQQGI